MFIGQIKIVSDKLFDTQNLTTWRLHHGKTFKHSTVYS